MFERLMSMVIRKTTGALSRARSLSRHITLADRRTFQDPAAPVFGCRRLRRARSLHRLLAVLEALQPLDLLHMRHEDGVGRIARQLRTDVRRLRGEEGDFLAADEVRADDATQQRTQLVLHRSPAVGLLVLLPHLAGGLADRPRDDGSAHGANSVHARVRRYLAVDREECRPVAARAAAAASLWMACQGGPINRPMAFRNASTSSMPSAAAPSRSTRSPSYPYTDQPRASATAARAWRYMTESATVCARLSLIRSSIVRGRSGHARMAMLAIGTSTAAASASRLSRAPHAAATRTRSTRATASASETARAPAVFR